MKSSIVRVHVNGIEVGSLPAKTYHAIVKDVRRDRRLYLAWTLSATHLVLRKLFQLFSAIPTIIVGLIILMALFSPELFTQLLVGLRTSEPEAIAQGLRKLITTIATVAAFAFPLSAIFAPSHWRIQNPFASAISRKIRQVLEVPAEGELMVEIIEQPSKAE